MTFVRARHPKVTFVERYEVATVVTESFERCPRGIAATAQELVRILDGVKLLLRRVRITIGVRLSDEFTIHALNIARLIVHRNAEKLRRGFKFPSLVRLRRQRVHGDLERSPILQSVLDLIHVQILDSTHHEGHRRHVLLVFWQHHPHRRHAFDLRVLQRLRLRLRHAHSLLFKEHLRLVRLPIRDDDFTHW